MTKECKQQFTLRITQANATQLVVILYEMTLQYLADAEQAAEDAQFLEAVRRTRGCINELLNSLHREYSPATELSRLYLYCIRNNSQTVYAGLTYGRDQLTENMADQGSNRGMLV